MKDTKGVYNTPTQKFSRFSPVDILPIKGRSWVTNGPNNSNYKVYDDAYDDSPTNHSIIEAYVNYTYADGIENVSLLNDIDISIFMSEEARLLICRDYKLYGGYALQVIWDANEEDPKPLRVEYMPVNKLGVNYDMEDEEDVNGYWYSFDWTKKFQYPPELYPRFTGKWKGSALEILMVRRPTREIYFPVPDYLPAIPYALTEGLLANAAKSFFDNSLSVLTVINFNNGMISDEEAREKAANQVRESYTGPEGSGKVLVSFNEDPTMGVTVDQISPPEMGQQTTFYAEEAERKIIVAHSAPPILFAGSTGGSGFSSNADEIEISQQMLYRRHINPMRKVILGGLKKVFDVIDPTIKLDFIDFGPIKLDKTE